MDKIKENKNIKFGITASVSEAEDIIYIKEKPDYNSPNIGRVKINSSVLILEKVLSNGEEWFKVNFEDNKIGYLVKGYVLEVDGVVHEHKSFEKYALVLEDEIEIIRVNSTPEYGDVNRIASVNSGSIIKVNMETETNSENWYRATFNNDGQNGYFVNYTLSFLGTPLSEETYYLNTGWVDVKEGTYLTVRDYPSTSGGKIDEVHRCDEIKIFAKVRVKGETIDWYRILIGDKTGYVRSDYITLAAEEFNTKFGVTASESESEDAIYIKEKPDYSSANIGRLKVNSSVLILKKVFINGENWFKVNFGDNKTGYLVNGYVLEVNGIVEEHICFEKYALVLADGPGKIRINSTPAYGDINYIASINPGKVVKVNMKTITDSENWYRATFNNDNQNGYFVDYTLSFVGTPLNEEVYYSNEGWVNVKEGTYLTVRSYPTINGDKVAELYKGDKVNIFAKVKVEGETIDWYRILIGNETGYVRSDYVSMSGEESNGTENMFSEKGMYFMKEKEGFGPQKYIDPVGVLTQGYGLTGAELNNLPTTMTEAHATERLVSLSKRSYLTPMLNAMKNDGIKLNFTSRQIDALVSFVYNLGLGGLRSSTFYKLMKNGDRGSAQFWSSWLAHNKGDNNQVLPGLVIRRNDEKKIWENSGHVKGYDSAPTISIIKTNGQPSGKVVTDNNGYGAKPII